MSAQGQSQNNRIVYLSHGGGPLPLLGDDGHTEMISTLKTIAASITKPSAIIIISAHWEEQEATITSGNTPELIYDYYGFPEQSYSIQYPAPGNPELAQQISSLLQGRKIENTLDGRRGFDHGLFIPLKIMYPEADIPCIQLSLVNNLDPQHHLQLGEALAGLEAENILVIGSGFSFHNMREFFAAATAESTAKNESFEAWLIDTCSKQPYEEGAKRLTNWLDAPAARFCHPREEHLLPLHVCYGMAQGPCNQVFEHRILGKKASAYLW